ncbi:MFS transporter [Candidatus Woesearchaeota archaeon]|nr:MFS transporter [Candidatus Woesearchaeota archaeon]
MLHHTPHHWNFLFRHEVNVVYLSVALRSFGISLLGLFVPLYLIKDQDFSLAAVLGFYLFFSVILAISTPIAGAFSARFGMKHTVLVSVPLYLGFLFLLYFLPFLKIASSSPSSFFSRISLLLPAALLGISIAFYWMGLHQVIYRVSTRKHRGEAIGKQKAVTVLGTIAGPLVGGFIISFSGFPLLFAVAAVFLILSAGFLLFNKEKHTSYHFSLRSLVPGKEHWKNSLFFVSQGTRVIADGMLWPLLVFFLLEDYLSLGFLGTLFAGGSALLLWFMGRKSDHYNKRDLVRWLTPLESASWFFRSLVDSFSQILGITIFSVLVTGVREAPLSALEYDKAQGDITAYFVNREIFVALGRIFMLTFVLLTDSITGGLFFQGIANLAVLLF